MEILAETIGVVDGAALFSRLGEQFAACVGETVRRAADAHDGGELDAVEQGEIIRSVVADKAGKFGRAVFTGAVGRRTFGAETVDLGGTALQLEMYIWFYIFRALGQTWKSETPEFDARE